MKDEKIYEQLGELKFNKKLKPDFAKKLKSFVTGSHDLDIYDYEFCYFYIKKNGNLGIKRESWDIGALTYWLKYLIKNYFEPNGYKLSGNIKNSLSGEIYEIIVKSNKISKKKFYDNNNLSFLKYVKSDDIRSHIKKEKYNFSAIQAASLVNSLNYSMINYKSGRHVTNISINEKIKIYNYIIKNFPDKTENIYYTTPFYSHKYIKDYINLEKKKIADFKKTKSGYTYMWKIVFSDNSKDDIFMHGFKAFNLCFSDVKKYIKNSKMPEIKKGKFSIEIARGNKTKSGILEEPTCISYLNSKFEFIEFNYNGNYDVNNLSSHTILNSCCVPLIYPFKDGDLLTYHDDNNEILLYNANEDFTAAFNGAMNIYDYNPDDPYKTNLWLQMEHFRGDKKKSAKKINELKKGLDKYIDDDFDNVLEEIFKGHAKNINSMKEKGISKYEPMK